MSCWITLDFEGGALPNLAIIPFVFDMFMYNVVDQMEVLSLLLDGRVLHGPLFKAEATFWSSARALMGRAWVKRKNDSLSGWISHVSATGSHRLVDLPRHIAILTSLGIQIATKIVSFPMEARRGKNDVCEAYGLDYRTIVQPPCFQDDARALAY